MNDREAIDHLNTIINERESAVYLKAVLEQASNAEGRVGNAVAALASLDKQLAEKRVLLANIDAEYQKREAALKRHYDDVLEKVDKNVHQAELDAVKAKQDVEAKVTEAHASLVDMHNAIGMANQKKMEAEEAMKRSVDALKKAEADYKAYKDSLK